MPFCFLRHDVSQNFQVVSSGILAHQQALKMPLSLPTPALISKTFMRILGFIFLYSLMYYILTALSTPCSLSIHSSHNLPSLPNSLTLLSLKKKASVAELLKNMAYQGIIRLGTLPHIKAGQGALCRRKTVPKSRWNSQKESPLPLLGVP